MLLVAIVGDELVLVETVGELLVDRVTLRVLDPAGVVLVGVPVPAAVPVAA